jgi:nicotinate-nucleotide pyrophosphorylase (carboxylating)
MPTPIWGSPEQAAAQALLDLAWQEDLNGAGDVTSKLLLPANLLGKATFVARQTGVISGLPILRLVFAATHPSIVIQEASQDGEVVAPGSRLARLEGPLQAILTGERIALNFLQRLSGVATQTLHYAQAIENTGCTLLDTRKTTPGWRVLEKYAVRCGGGQNHRMGLYDAILIKDNHLAALQQQGQTLVSALRKAQHDAPASLTLEMEVDKLSQLQDILPLQPHRVLLDNMNLNQLSQAVQLRNQLAPHVKLEASGGITLATIGAVARTGVDFISSGALTHSAPALDIALDYED